jgi:hypothetical protein
MKEQSSGKAYIDRIRSWTRSKAHGGHDSILPVTERKHPQSIPPPSLSNTKSSNRDNNARHDVPNNSPAAPPAAPAASAFAAAPLATRGGGAGETAPSTQDEGQGPLVEPSRRSSQNDAPKEQSPEEGGQEDEEKKQETRSVPQRLWRVARMVLLHSWLNVLLVFVPVGIITHVVHARAEVVFAMNAIAIIPLAGLLSYATESVAHKMGDAIGALLNITFGNAVELIIL